MEEVFINTIQDFNDYQGVETLHPLVVVEILYGIEKNLLHIILNLSL